MLDTVSRSGRQPQSVRDAGGLRGFAVAGRLAGIGPQPPDAAQVADAIARYRAYQGLREFRARLYECLTARPDACFELCDGAPRGAVVPDGGERPSIALPSQRRGEAGGSLSRGSPGRAGAASTKSRRFRTAGWAGRGERDGKVYARNRLRYAS